LSHHKLHGTFETTDLNGITVENFLVAPNSTLDVIVDAVGGGGIQGTGYFVDSFIHFDLVTDPPPCSEDLDGSGDVGFNDDLARAPHSPSRDQWLKRVGRDRATS
jgi:hypothetical protein